jgi:hydrogenase-4 membrane subunit HyfE
MILRGLVVAIGGFLFIFAPGLPMWVLIRRYREFERDLLYWGIGTWFIAMLPMLFLQSLLRQFILGAGSSDVVPEGAWRFLLPFLSAVIGALVVQGALYLVLRRKRPEKSAQFMDGLSLGFGSGLVIQVFIGFTFVSAGFRLSFGDLSTPFQTVLAELPLHTLLIWLLAHILYRVAVPMVSGALGVLLARAAAGHLRFLWLAIATYAIFESAFGFIQLGMSRQSAAASLAEGMNPTNLLVTVAYYVLAFVLAYRWLLSQKDAQDSESTKRGG